MMQTSLQHDLLESPINQTWAENAVCQIGETNLSIPINSEHKNRHISRRDHKNFLFIQDSNTIALMGQPGWQHVKGHYSITRT